jgi:hypothetical protein
MRGGAIHRTDAFQDAVGFVVERLEIDVEGTSKMRCPRHVVPI